MSAAALHRCILGEVFLERLVSKNAAIHEGPEAYLGPHRPKWHGQRQPHSASFPGAVCVETRRVSHLCFF